MGPSTWHTARHVARTRHVRMRPRVRLHATMHGTSACPKPNQINELDEVHVQLASARGARPCVGPPAATPTAHVAAASGGWPISTAEMPYVQPKIPVLVSGSCLGHTCTAAAGGPHAAWSTGGVRLPGTAPIHNQLPHYVPATTSTAGQQCAWGPPLQERVSCPRLLDSCPDCSVPCKRCTHVQHDVANGGVSVLDNGQVVVPGGVLGLCGSGEWRAGAWEKHPQVILRHIPVLEQPRATQVRSEQGYSAG